MSAFHYVTNMSVELAKVEFPTSIERDHRGELVITTGHGEVVSVERP